VYAPKCQPGEFCSSGGTCLECVDDDDCGADETCDDGTCVDGPCLDVGSLATLNALFCGSYTMTYTDIEGRAAIAQNFTFTGGVGNKVYAEVGVTDVLIVGGTYSSTNGQVFGNAWYGVGTNVTPQVGFLGAQIQGTPAGFSFTQACNHAALLSTQLAGLTPNGTVTQLYGAVRLTGTDPTLNVFQVSAAIIGSANGLHIDVPKGVPTVINVIGSSVTFQNYEIWLGADDHETGDDPTVHQIVWNLPDATSLTISGLSIEGSLIAPTATVSFNNGHINGSMMAAGGSGNGQFHHKLFTSHVCPPGQPGGDVDPGQSR